MFPVKVGLVTLLPPTSKSSTPVMILELKFIEPTLALLKKRSCPEKMKLSEAAGVNVVASCFSPEPAPVPN